MKLKRILALSLALLLLLFTAVACKPGDGNDTGTKPVTTPDTQAPGTTDPGTVDPPVSEYLSGIDTAAVDALWAESMAKADAILANRSEIVPAEGCQAWYVSELNGNDKNDGQTPETAWKTLDRVIVKSRKTIQAGDVVYFERGGIYRASDFGAVDGVSYTAYGEGAMPIITSAYGNVADPSYWKQTEENPNVWVTSKFVDGFDVGNIVFNGGEAQGSKVYLEYYDETVDGAWGNVMDGLPFEGYWDLKSELQFYYARPDGGNAHYVYLYCSAGNPGEIYDSIEFCHFSDVMGCNGNTDVLIDGLSIRYGGQHGITLGGSTNLVVQNCEVAYIGGAIRHYYINGEDSYRRWDGPIGNGIEAWGACNGFTVNNCYLHNISEEAITTQANGADMLDIHYTNNVITYARQAFSLWGENATDVVEVTGNDCWYMSYGHPAVDHMWYGEDEGAMQINANAGTKFTMKDNLFAFAGACLLKLDPWQDGFEYGDNVYIAEDISYVKVSGKTYHWDAAGAEAVVVTANDTTAKCYLYDDGTPESQRTLDSMTLPADVKAGDTVTFGAYEQDGDTANGKEAIQWIVLDVKDGQALLLSKYVLDCSKYAPMECGISWGSSEMREFLDGGFSAAAFTAAELSKLNAVTVAMGSSPTETSGDAGAESKVFLLSAEELLAYLGEGNLAAEVTPYAASLKGFAENIPVKDGYATYWVRNLGRNGKFAGMISWNGEYDAYGAFWNVSCNKGVRPATWVTVG